MSGNEMPSLPIPGRKGRQMPRQGFPRGGGGVFKLPFDWYIILDIIEYYRKIHYLTREFRVKLHAKTDIARIAKRWVRYRFSSAI